MLITAWWDVYRQFAPGHNPCKRRVRPLRVLERALGHRVQISGFTRFERRPPDEYQYTAYSWLDAETIDDAVTFILRQLSRFECPIQDGPSRLNRNAFAGDEELDDTIGTFYWNTHKQPPLVDIDSGGVLLMASSHADRRHDPRALPTHTVRVPRVASPRANFAIVAELKMMGDPQDVREFHWPRYRDAYGMHGFDIVAFKGRSGPGNHNHLTVGCPVWDASEATAICTALACVRGVEITLDFGGDVPLSAVPSQRDAEGLVSLRILREH